MKNPILKNFQWTQPSLVLFRLLDNQRRMKVELRCLHRYLRQISDPEVLKDYDSVGMDIIETIHKCENFLEENNRLITPYMN